MPRSADSSIKEESCRSADVGWLMSYGGNQVLALPSIMEFVADHWLAGQSVSGYCGLQCLLIIMFLAFQLVSTVSSTILCLFMMLIFGSSVCE